MDSGRTSTPTVESHSYSSASRLGDVYHRRVVELENLDPAGMLELWKEAAQIDANRTSIEVQLLKFGNLRGMSLPGVRYERMIILEEILRDVQH